LKGARFIEEGVTETARRIAARYVGEEEAAVDTEALRGGDVIVRIELGHVRPGITSISSTASERCAWSTTAPSYSTSRPTSNTSLTWRSPGTLSLTAPNCATSVSSAE
jgi:hypothetical protein